MNNSLLYVVHLCMRGNDNVVDNELFEGKVMPLKLPLV